MSEVVWDYQMPSNPSALPNGEKTSHVRAQSIPHRHTFNIHIPINGHLLFLPRSANDFGEPHISALASPASYSDHSLALVPRTPRHLASSLMNLTAPSTAQMDKRLKGHLPILIQNRSVVKEKRWRAFVMQCPSRSHDGCLTDHLNSCICCQ